MGRQRAPSSTRSHCSVADSWASRRCDVCLDHPNHRVLGYSPVLNEQLYMVYGGSIDRLLRPHARTVR